MSNKSHMNETLEAEVSEPKHKCTFAKKLEKFYSIAELKAEAPFKNAVFGLDVKDTKIAVSWWVSAKRTRSYPYARVYDTLGFDGRRATIIPFVKDEGAEGERDFLQWDTISLMSLLSVYVILAFYVKAERSSVKGKITNQRFDCEYLAKRFEELAQAKISAHEWNVHEIESNLKFVAEMAKKGYQKIQNETKIKLHGESGIDKAIELISEGVEKYKDRSRIFADKAQRREAVTLQPKEHVTVAKKWMIIIRNRIGGYYPWTIDEMIRIKNSVFLIEKKHSARKRLPALGDIKDGFLRLIVYNNIFKLLDSEGKKLRSYACLGLTSALGTGACCNISDKNVSSCKLNLSKRELDTLQKVFNEGTINGIVVLYLGRDVQNQEESILTRAIGA